MIGENPTAIPLTGMIKQERKYTMSNLTYGVYSTAYDPASGNRIDSLWADNVRALGATKVRVVIDSRPSDDNISQLLPTYYATCSTYRDPTYPQRDIQVVGVLTHNTLRSLDPTAPLSARSTVYTNDYIDRFSERAGEIAAYLNPMVDVFEIWNEPNVWRRCTSCAELSSEHFGSMLYYCTDAIKTKNINAKIVSGGLYYDQYLPNGWDGAYLNGGQQQGSACCEVGLYKSKGAQEWFRTHGRYPWDYLGVHTYHAYSPGNGIVVNSLYTTRINQINQNDPAEIWVTEFGARLIKPNYGQQVTELNWWFD